VTSAGRPARRYTAWRPSELDTGPRPLTEAAIGFQRQRPEMVHQRTLVRGKREPLGSTNVQVSTSTPTSEAPRLDKTLWVLAGQVNLLEQIVVDKIAVS
jgi:hypothetical protein